MIATTSPFAAERAKYTEIWRDVPAYRTLSPGEQLVGPFLGITGARPGQSIVDVGCGTGRASLKFIELLMRVTLIDATREALDPAVAAALEAVPAGDVSPRFRAACLWQDWIGVRGDVPCDFAFCCDVLEHLPTEFTMLVVARCLQAAPRAFFHVNCEPDQFGGTIGQPLHLTVQPFVWWRDRLADVGTLLEARDLLGSGLFLLERN